MIFTACDVPPPTLQRTCQDGRSPCLPALSCCLHNQGKEPRPVQSSQPGCLGLQKTTHSYGRITPPYSWNPPLSNSFYCGGTRYLGHPSVSWWVYTLQLYPQNSRPQLEQSKKRGGRIILGPSQDTLDSLTLTPFQERHVTLLQRCATSLFNNPRNRSLSSPTLFRPRQSVRRSNWLAPIQPWTDRYKNSTMALMVSSINSI